MQTTLKELRSYFYGKFGVSLPQIALPSDELNHSSGSGYISGDLFGITLSNEHQYLMTVT